MSGAAIGLFSTFRRERLGYVVLLCACLAMQGAFPAIASAVFGDRPAALSLVLCDGSVAGSQEDGLRLGSQPCVSGHCAMAGCGGFTLPGSSELNFGFLPGVSPVFADSRIVPIDSVGQVAIRGPPFASRISLDFG